MCPMSSPNSRRQSSRHHSSRKYLSPFDITSQLTDEAQVRIDRWQLAVPSGLFWPWDTAQALEQDASDPTDTAAAKEIQA